MRITPRPSHALTLGAALASALLATGCSSVSNALSGDKIDYRSSGSQSVRLDVPPDLSQLPGQQRYSQATPAIVSASSLARQNPQPAGEAAPAAIAPSERAGVRLERQGQTRWLVVNQAPEAIYAQVRAFWTELGFELPVDRPEAGVMETSFSENRAKLPEDGLRNLLGRVFEVLYDSGMRDAFRTRIERTATGSEVYITHRGMSEEYTDSRKEQTTWRARPSDAGLEAEMLSRLMVKLGAPKEAAAAAREQAAVATPAAEPTASAVKLGADGTTLTLQAEGDLAWRRVGLALDRSGFTVEARDRKAGTYDVRISVDDPEATKPGFFGRLMGRSSEETLARYKVRVQPQGSVTLVSVLTDGGAAANSPTGKRIAKRLADELN
ncbi:MAG: outer membrane protein assembly factor BamC [Proteobacteria bacterium]|uniref:outer membrane protein assembly factor BamC n=1 Tax=Aquabacterium sp. TaxID=1872578 RepID=UPI0035C762F5|nr:outer membrane protein assembly factor BamC [Pseudomonadota bacterium]